MKVIVRGRIPSVEVFKVECLNCHSEIEFERGESRSEYTAMNENFLVITCPICKKEIWKSV